MQTQLDRCDREIAKIADYNQPYAWLNAVGEADWEAEKFLISEEENKRKMDSIKNVHLDPREQALALNSLSHICHEANKKWWADLSRPCVRCNGQGEMRGLESIPAECLDCAGLGYARKDRNTGELLMLCVSELAEAMEGDRKDLPDDKLPHLPMFDVEIADCLIRIFDLCGGKGRDIGRAFIEKMAFNARREDHTIEHRLGAGGKKY